MACIPTPPLLDFALDIYRHIQAEHASDKGNIFCSPLSIAVALAMTVAGARGNTADEIMSAMRVQHDFPIHRHLSELVKDFKKFTADVTLHMANRIFLEKEFAPLPEFSKLLHDSYDTTSVSVDFRHAAEQCRQQINLWVHEATKGKIQDLLPPGMLDEFTRLVIVNAVYFKGLWDKKFDPIATKEMDFHETRSTSRKVEMMFQKGKFRTSRCDDLKVSCLILPYKGNDVAMALLLPDDIEGLSSLEASLTAEKFTSLVFGAESGHNVSVWLPKFKVEHATALKSVLRKMGMNQAFGMQADLTGISARNDLQVSEVVHKAFVEVNEEGTEAAAATAVVVRMKRCLELFEEVDFKADHPFMFAIILVESQVVLFMGSLRRP